MLRIIGPSWSEILSRQSDQWNWYVENVVDPLVDEVHSSAEGDFPGEPGNYESKWDDFDEQTRGRVKADLAGKLDEYTESLDDLNTEINREEQFVQTFIRDLPGGELDGEPTFTGNVVSSSHGLDSRAMPQMRGQDVLLSDWIQEMWPAFEAASNAVELKTQLVDRNSELSYSDDIFQHWESAMNQPNWNQILWDLYQEDLLTNYHDSLLAQESLCSDIKEISASIEEDLQDINQSDFLRTTGFLSGIAGRLKD